MYDDREANVVTDVHHATVVFALAAFLRPANYVELGIWDGETICRVAEIVKDCVGVDIRQVDISESGARFHLGKSVDYLQSVPDESIDMCFVDSLHEAWYTYEEFVLLDKKIKKNGVVLFHDTYPPNNGHLGSASCGNVYMAIKKIKEEFSDRWEFCTLPAQYGVTIARKNLGKQIMWGM